MAQRTEKFNFTEAEEKDPYLKRRDQGAATAGYPAVFVCFIALYGMMIEVLNPTMTNFLSHMLVILFMHDLANGSSIIGYLLLLLVLLAYRSVVSYLHYCVERGIGCEYLRLLYQKGSVRVFHPLSITKQGSHYAANYRGRDGFYRVDRTDRYKTFFTPSLNVFAPRLTVSSWLGLHVSCDFRSSRLDADYILVEALSWHQDVWYYDPFLHFVSGELAVLGYIREGVCFVKLQASRYIGCELKLGEYDALRFRTGAKPNMGYMEVVSKDMDFPKDDIPNIAMVLKQELRALEFEPWVECKAVGGDGDVEAELLLEEGREPDMDRARSLGKLLPQPFDQESITYAFNYASEEVTLQERILKYKDTGGKHKVPTKYYAYRNEFVQMMIPDACVHSLAPDDLEVVLDRQKRASQVLGYEETKDLPNPNFSLVDATFQKGEVYGVGKAPRLIINPSAPKRVETNSIIYPLTDCLKANGLKGIYGFGDAQYIQDNFENFEQRDDLDSFETDVSGMDANTIKFFREMDEMILKRAFSEVHHQRVLDNHRAQYEPSRLRFKKGHVVDLEHMIRSGEGGTSTWNTAHGTFVEYCWIREMGYSPVASKKLIGLHGGDDGLSKALGTEESLKQVGADLHLPLKVKRVKKGEPFSFLGLTKMPGIPLYSPDVVRFCSKIAYTHVKGVPLNQVLYRKCEPYVRMYPNVPLVGNLCRAVVRILSKQGVKVDSRYDELCRSGVGYMMTMLDGAQFPGPETTEEYNILEAYVCESLGISLTVLRGVCDAYDGADEFKDFPSGYIHKDNALLNSAFSFLLRDLYIRGPSVMNFESNVPTEASPAVQKIPLKHDQTQLQNQQEGGDTTPSSASSTIETDSSTSVKTDAKPHSKKKKRSGPDKRRS